MEETNRVLFIHVPQPASRSVSPMTPSPCREKNLGFFHALSRRFCRRSTEDLHINCEEDSRSSSTDSCSSTSGGRLPAKNIQTTESSLEISCSVSESSSSNESTATRKSNIETTRNSRRSSSIRRALQSLSLSSRSLSCSGTPTKETGGSLKQQKKSKKPPQRILRQPVSYTYLKGISGLPTQRVPRSSLCCNYSHR